MSADRMTTRHMTQKTGKSGDGAGSSLPVSLLFQSSLLKDQILSNLRRQDHPNLPAQYHLKENEANHDVLELSCQTLDDIKSMRSILLIVDKKMVFVEKTPGHNESSKNGCNSALSTEIETNRDLQQTDKVNKPSKGSLKVVGGVVDSDGLGGGNAQMQNVTTTGSPQAVDTARDHIHDSQPQGSGGMPTTETVLVQEKVGQIIGRGGETTRFIQEQCGVKINVDPTALPDGSYQVTISGAKEAIERAKQILEKDPSSRKRACDTNDTNVKRDRNNSYVASSIILGPDAMDVDSEPPVPAIWTPPANNECLEWSQNNDLEALKAPNLVPTPRSIYTQKQKRQNANGSDISKVILFYARGLDAQARNWEEGESFTLKAAPHPSMNFAKVNDEQKQCMLTKIRNLYLAKEWKVPQTGDNSETNPWFDNTGTMFLKLCHPDDGIIQDVQMVLNG